MLFYVLTKLGSFVGKGYLHNSSFVAFSSSSSNTVVSFYSTFFTESFSIWHDRLGHVDSRKFVRIMKMNLIPKSVSDFSS